MGQGDTNKNRVRKNRLNSLRLNEIKHRFGSRKGKRGFEEMERSYAEKISTTNCFD